eukprot:4114600-Pyramimonas_sp.AAC.1
MKLGTIPSPALPPPANPFKPSPPPASTAPRASTSPSPFHNFPRDPPPPCLWGGGGVVATRTGSIAVSIAKQLIAP